MNKKQASAHKIGFIHFLRTVGLFIGLLFVVTALPMLLIEESSQLNIDVVSGMMFVLYVVAFLGAVFTSTYATKKVYEIKDAKNIVLIASAYYLGLTILFAAFEWFVSGALPVVSSLVEVIVFYAISHWRIKNDVVVATTITPAV
jgi:hypothetical protein